MSVEAVPTRTPARKRLAIAISVCGAATEKVRALEAARAAATNAVDEADREIAATHADDEADGHALADRFIAAAAQGDEARPLKAAVTDQGIHRRVRAEAAQRAARAATKTLEVRLADATTVLAEATNALNTSIRAVMVEDVDRLVAEAEPLIAQLRARQATIRSVVNAGGVVLNGVMANFPAPSHVRLVLDLPPAPPTVDWQRKPGNDAVRGWVLALATDADATLQPPQTPSANAEAAA